MHTPAGSFIIHLSLPRAPRTSRIVVFGTRIVDILEGDTTSPTFGETLDVEECHLVLSVVQITGCCADSQERAHFEYFRSKHLRAPKVVSVPIAAISRYDLGLPAFGGLLIVFTSFNLIRYLYVASNGILSFGQSVLKKFLIRPINIMGNK